MANYDHHKKAGNQGDIVKHPALIAAVDTVLETNGKKTFRYADTFAGYAWNPLEAGHEWRAGIGKIGGQPGLARNRHVAMWAEWYGLHVSPQVGQRYPGSARIVADICRQRGVRVEMALWDISEPVIQRLNGEFGGQGHAIFHQPFDCSDAFAPYARNANFLFFDPPDKTRNWKVVSRFLQDCRPEQQVLVWLPIGVDTTASPPNEDGESANIRQTVLTTMPGFRVTKVRWASGGRTIGCQLIYRIIPPAVNALKEAVDCVVQVAGWNHEDTTHF